MAPGDSLDCFVPGRGVLRGDMPGHKAQAATLSARVGGIVDEKLRCPVKTHGLRAGDRDQPKEMWSKSGRP